MFNTEDNQSRSDTSSKREEGKNSFERNNSIELPQINLPKGGGAIKGIEEKFQVNAVTGTSSFSIPLPISPSRQGFSPSIGLSYNSGNGNSPFGIGWNLNIPSISRKTEKKLPFYEDSNESDTYIIGGIEDLVPLLEKQGGEWIRYSKQRLVDGISYTIKRYIPRIEGSFSRIERWINNTSGEVHWKTISTNNIHSYFGLTSESRISDPDDPSKIFEWLLCRMHDDKGNISLYEYKKEDFAGVPNTIYEKNKLENCTQLYIKKVLYGNKTPYYLNEPIPAENNFMFRLIFDYGEHNAAVPIPQNIINETNIWTCRKDSFSSFRSGFEIRTYRRCRRVLMFHCFDELPINPYLTKSLELLYDDDLDYTGSGKKEQGFSFLVMPRLCGHIWDTASHSYSSKALPEMEISYQQHVWNTEVNFLSDENSVHTPAGLSDRRYLWYDLFSEGISGILTEQGGNWYYKSNLGGGDFSQAMPVSSLPSFSNLSNGRISLREISGDGSKYLVQMDNEVKGFFKLSDEDEWEHMKLFQSVPSINLLDRNTRSIDLTGDGKADILITEDTSLLWYESLGEEGFAVSKKVCKEIDEEKGPAIVFSDGEQCIYLADMNGDGLTDILRIRNCEICYWPNLGYGRFGKKVSMENSPVFDSPELFNPQFIRLADIDGSGTIDVIYLGNNDFRVWMNNNGNEWSLEPHIISSFPAVDNLADIAILDFLGSGTACIVYSTPLGNKPIWYIDLMNSKKPNLFIGYKNNCGKEVDIEYKSSTHFYMEDKKEGRKWITKLPFPVHCISKTTVRDKVRESVFTSSYRYSHGYYDHEEREYRGFGRVEQLDTEDFSKFKLNESKNVVDETLHQAPVKTITWFHTGAFIQNGKILHQYENEYFNNTEFTEYKIPDAIIPEGLTNDELREAYRACKNLPLRVEVYANDNLPQSTYPYSVSQVNAEIRLYQPKQKNKYVSLLVLPSESISYSYERNPSDPRISHSFLLEADAFGCPLKGASVIYKRVARPSGYKAVPDKVWEEQNKSHIVSSESFYTNDVHDNDTYRLRVPCESKSFEIGGVNIPNGIFISKEDLKTYINNASEILFEDDFTAGVQKRLSSHGRSYFLKDDLSSPLPLGELSGLSIGHKSYQMAFTKNLISKFYGTKVTDSMLSNAKYVHSEGDEHWWTQSGEAIFPVNAKDKFYMPIGFRDVFGTESFVEYDSYFLTVKSNTDAIGNMVSVVCDYRTLSPYLVTDANMNRSAVETDELGMVVKSAVMGKDGSGEGDTLSDPTARTEYDLFNWKNNGKPNYVHTFLREKHADPLTRWHESYVYSDGSGNLVMTKIQAEPGKARKWNDITNVVDEVDADPRWVGNGRTIYNNKGNSVKKYEPYFSSTHEYENEDELVETGFTPVFYYDAKGRNIKTEFPNGTFTKFEFDTWCFKSHDANDTVKDSLWYLDRGSPNPDTDPEPSETEKRAAWLAAKHYNTPGTMHTDSLGRTFYAVTDYSGGKTTHVFSESDMFARFTKSYDQFGRIVSEGYVNMGGATIYGKSAEKGEKWILLDVLGRLVKIWENGKREFRAEFDKLHRPVSTFVKENGNEILFNYIFYGDSLADAADRNLKGRAYKLFDQAGSISITVVDFKGNVTSAERKLTKEYNQNINWKALNGLTTIADIDNASAPLLETEKFVSASELDALNRPVTITLPDNSMIKVEYNIAHFIDSLRVKIGGLGDFVTFLENQDYNAKGQRQFAKYGNGLITNYYYDPKTFRLINLVTQKDGAALSGSHQNLFYTFDPVGNIVQIKDDAQQTHYFKNAAVKPEFKFSYDSVYQLKTASGRELAGLGGADTQRNNNDLPFINQIPHINDLNSIRNYTEQYEYDDLGNILTLKHNASGADWVQHYHYEYQDNPGNNTNRLKSTSAPSDPDGGPYTASYSHDNFGNITSMPHLSASDSLKWDFMDSLKQVNLGGGGTAYYVYGVGNNRIRKVIERIGSKKTERIYLGPVEIYREYQNGNKRFERNTLHISDNAGKIAQVDTKLLDLDNVDPSNDLNSNLIRYQYGNHLGSAAMESDEEGTVISYEEYHPYGTSSYRSSKSGVNLSLKRYRFSGKEKDDETGFYYFGARYYAPWLGRWTSSDPAGFVRGFNLYNYCSNNPVTFMDPNGMNDIPPVAPPPIAYTPGEEGRRGTIDFLNNNWIHITWNGTRIRFRVNVTEATWHEGEESSYWQASQYTITEAEPVAAGGGEETPEEEGGYEPVNPGGSGGNGGVTSGNGGNGGDANASGPGGGGNDPASSLPAIPPGPAVSVVNPSTLPPGAPVPKIDLPQAPPGTNFRAAEAAGRANARNIYPFQPGEQAQHYLKWRQGRDTNLDPAITNDPRYMGPLQSRNALSGPGYPRTLNGRTFGNPHTYADRGLYPMHETNVRNTYGDYVSDRVVHVEAGRRTMQDMTGSRGPRPPYIWFPTAIGAAGNIALATTRTIVPGVAEGEIILLGASQTATYYGYFGAAAALETGAAYVPIVGGSAMAGAVAGHFADNAVTGWTGSSEWGTAAGVVTSAAAGAAVGALIGSVVPVAGTVVGAGVGAAVGAVAGLGAYLITKFW